MLSYLYFYLANLQKINVSTASIVRGILSNKSKQKFHKYTKPSKYVSVNIVKHKISLKTSNPSK